ncbi:MAG: shikimate kinase [Candidatus Eutrophobiaceae bacterium]
MNIFLVGMMGAGKTTVGRSLAKCAEMDFHDSDCEIERITGANVATIFELEGEQGFRVRERKMLRELMSLQDIVLATGGGAILDAQNRDALKAKGFSVYLQSSVEFLHERLRNSFPRPLMAVENPLKVLQDLLRLRDPLYRGVADLTVSVENKNLRRIVAEIMQAALP